MAVERALSALPPPVCPGRRWTYLLAEAGERGLPLIVRRYGHGCLLHVRQTVSGVGSGRRTVGEANHPGRLSGPVAFFLC